MRALVMAALLATACTQVDRDVTEPATESRAAPLPKVYTPPGPPLALKACPGPPVTAPTGGSSLSTARDLFRAGVQLYDEGDYGAAAGCFQDAHALVPRPELRFNLGQTLLKLNRTAEARTELQAYLAEKPDAANAAEVRAVLAKLP